MSSIKKLKTTHLIVVVVVFTDLSTVGNKVLGITIKDHTDP